MRFPAIEKIKATGNWGKKKTQTLETVKSCGRVKDEEGCGWLSG